MEEKDYIGVEKGVDIPIDIEGLRENTGVYVLSANTIRRLVFEVSRAVSESAALNQSWSFGCFMGGFFSAVLIIALVENIMR